MHYGRTLINPVKGCQEMIKVQENTEDWKKQRSRESKEWEQGMKESKG